MEIKLIFETHKYESYLNTITNQIFLHTLYKLRYIMICTAFRAIIWNGYSSK
ncbi:hypothetical protein NEF87_001053 [Candidatus Lokiarchaeum ossiferum]|uniref:Uncharacterized protein n=1 Tax=Candidatus Lokiarchaeum ossiferum TaxID=2951803 RepID=A0ABY6HMM9_9ARCH|nr:hypothetical protein NEF87_001053 [Candidatus Lokiarchaeum sp. B-35]